MGLNASEMRRAAADSQRMSKTRGKWHALREKVDKWPCWGSRTELNGIKIGEKINFVDRGRSGGCLTLTMREGVLFAVGQLSFLVIYKGEIKKVKITNE